MSGRIIALVAAAALAGAGLAGCGTKGELKRPGPMFSKKQPAATEQQTEKPADTTLQTIDPRDRTVDPSPSRTAPIEGQSPDPFRSGPQGSLPDPYANPQ